MKSRTAFLIFASLLWTGTLAGAAEGPAAGGPMSPATISPVLALNPVTAAHCNGSTSLAFLNPSAEPMIIPPQGCGSCGNCTQPRTQCYVFGQGWGTCYVTRDTCGDGWKCECETPGGNL